MDSTKVSGFISGLWDDQIVPQLVEYIKIPNKSPMFDARWAEHGYMDQAVAQLAGWAKSHPIPGMSLEVVRLQGRTPVIFIDIPASGAAGNSDGDCVLLYGHLDKQPDDRLVCAPGTVEAGHRRRPAVWALVAPTTATQYSARWPRSSHCRSRASRIRAASF
jgi:hypothetical protein